MAADSRVPRPSGRAPFSRISRRTATLSRDSKAALKSSASASSTPSSSCVRSALRFSSRSALVRPEDGDSASSKSRPTALSALASAPGSTVSGVNARLGLASSSICSCSCTIAVIASWPSAIASTSNDSGTSPASASTIMIASLVPATTRFKSPLASSSHVGCTINSPSTRPIRTEATGPSKGTSDRVSAALPAIVPSVSGGFSMSTDSTVMTICVSSM